MFRKQFQQQQQAKNIPIISKSESKQHQCYSCPKIYTASQPDNVCQKCLRNVCSQCAPNKIIIPSVNTEQQNKICQQCFKELMDTQIFQQQVNSQYQKQNKIKLGEQSLWAIGVLDSIQEKSLVEDVSQDYTVLKEIQQSLKNDWADQQQVEQINRDCDWVKINSSYSLKEFYHFAFIGQEQDNKQLCNLILLLCKKQQTIYYIEYCHLSIFFLSLCDERTAFILITLLLKTSNYDIIETSEDYYQELFGSFLTKSQLRNLNKYTSSIQNFLLNCLNFQNQKELFEKILRGEDVLVHYAVCLLHLNQESFKWTQQSLFMSYMKDFQSLILHTKDIQKYGKRTLTLTNYVNNEEIENETEIEEQRTQRTRSLANQDFMQGFQIAQSIKKKQSCFFDSNDSNFNEIDEIYEQQMMGSPFQDQQQQKVKSYHENEEEIKQIKNDLYKLKGVLEVAIDQQYKIMSIGTIKAQKIVGEFVQIINESLSMNISTDLFQKVQELRSFYTKQELVDDPFKQNRSLALNELQSRYQETLEEYKKEIQSLQQTLKETQNDLIGTKKSCLDHQVYLNEFKNQDQEIQSQKKQIQMLNKICQQLKSVSQIKEQGRSSSMEQTQIYDQAFLQNIVSQNENGKLLLQQKEVVCQPDHIKDTTNREVIIIIEPRIELIPKVELIPRVELIRNNERMNDGHGQFCKQDECQIF